MRNTLPVQSYDSIKKVITYRSTLYHVDGHAIVGSMRVGWSMFTSIHSLWIT